MSQRLRIGVIGCGEISQIVHLPTLRELSDLFEVTALADPSAMVLEILGRQWPQAARLTNDDDLLSRSDVDAVLVANHHVYHAETTIRALAAGKHVLLEKPMCINLQEADQLLEAEAASGLVVQIGYMRRYAPALAHARTRLDPRAILLARVHDVIGFNSIIVSSTSTVVRRLDVAAARRESGRLAIKRAIMTAIGVSDGIKASTYELLLSLGCHDLSAMRELLGQPLDVLHVSAHAGPMLTALFDYGSFSCPCVIGIDAIPRYDTYLEVLTGDQVLRIEYDTPYIRNLPARLKIEAIAGHAGVSVQSTFDSRRDAFVVQWEAFYSNVVGGLKPKTSVADARLDLVLFQQMIACLGCTAPC
jgi:predicted dehydrogenase